VGKHLAKHDFNIYKETVVIYSRMNGWLPPCKDHNYKKSHTSFRDIILFGSFSKNHQKKMASFTASHCS